MEQFRKSLLDPAVWFSAMFCAIVVSILIPWWQNRVNRWLASSFGWYRSRRLAALSRREQRVERLAAEPGLLTLFTIRNGILWMFFFFFFGMFLFIPVWSDLIESSPRFASWFLYIPLPGIDRGTDRSAGSETIKLTIIILGAGSVFIGYTAMLQGSLAAEAYRRLYDRLKTAHEKPHE